MEFLMAPTFPLHFHSMASKKEKKRRKDGRFLGMDLPNKNKWRRIGLVFGESEIYFGILGSEIRTVVG